MLTIDSFVLYVESLEVSMVWYSKAFSCTPQQLSPTFAALNFAENVTITLKQSSDLQPQSSIKGGGTELSMPMPDKIQFEALFEKWEKQGITFAQKIQESVFGFNFVALDPDGHRIRVFHHVKSTS